MPLLRSLSRRDRPSWVEDERLRRYALEMRVATLPPIPVQPARRYVVLQPPEPQRHTVIDLREADGRTPEEPQAETLPEAQSLQKTAPGSPLTYRWDNAVELLRHLPRQVPAEATAPTARRVSALPWDDAVELLRRLEAAENAPTEEMQGELPIVVEVPGLMSGPVPAVVEEPEKSRAGGTPE